MIYKFKEKDILNEVMDYIDNTYRQHYANGVEKQATEIIIDQGHGEGFCMGNILKYAQRYGKKEGKNKHDLFKVIHQSLLPPYTLKIDVLPPMLSANGCD